MKLAVLLLFGTLCAVLSNSCGTVCHCPHGAYCGSCEHDMHCPVCWQNGGVKECGNGCMAKCTSDADCKSIGERWCNNVTGGCDNEGKKCGAKCSNDDDCEDNGCCPNCQGGQCVTSQSGGNCGNPCSCKDGEYCPQSCSDQWQNCPTCWNRGGQKECGDCCHVHCKSDSDCHCQKARWCNNITNQCDGIKQRCGRKCSVSDDCEDNGCCSNCANNVCVSSN
eukprot:NODE_1738_length_859_cov_102.318519_g1369_i0.p1 GENE.NODE_1738_length_859_cov_102.318519_g1369_i0~~NODE_1738_length_859_cov_102.318519_g1369_i0.p1  ORF type:complete len:222 (+),score=41.19 NODE_1738_length_859_cov_102.318519_g1369_i0:57-722(+)